MIRLAPALLAAAAALPGATSPAFAQGADAPTPGSVIAAAPAADWRAIDPADLMVMVLAPDAAGQERKVVLQLLPAPFSAGWLGNLRILARAHWWDGTSVYRVVDNWVTQWGDADGEEPGKAKPLPPGLATVAEEHYVTPVERGPQDGRDFVQTGTGREEIVVSRYLDPYAITGFVAGWPIGLDGEGGRTAWPVHCYGSVGVARNLSPDTGTGAELYAVNGTPPRALDRNIALVARVIAGMEHLATLPRGTGEAGVYADPAQRVPIVSVRLGDDLPAAEQPRFEYLAPTSASFAQLLQVRANRDDPFYRVPAGGVDVCNAVPPVRRVGVSAG